MRKARGGKKRRSRENKFVEQKKVEWRRRVKERTGKDACVFCTGVASAVVSIDLRAHKCR